MRPVIVTCPDSGPPIRILTRQRLKESKILDKKAQSQR